MANDPLARHKRQGAGDDGGLALGPKFAADRDKIAGQHEFRRARANSGCAPAWRLGQSLLDARHHGAAAAADAFIAAVNPLWPAALKRDLAAFPRSRLQIVRRADVRQMFDALREQDPAALDLLGKTAIDAEIALAQFSEFRVP